MITPNNEIPVFIQQGWQCPICGRIYSPTTMMCYYCGAESKSISTTAATSPTIDYLHHDSITETSGMTETRLVSAQSITIDKLSKRISQLEETNKQLRKRLEDE